MTLDEIVARIGEERFRAEAEIARKDASRPDYGSGSGATVDVPHEIEEWIWDTENPWVERVALFFSVYDTMPSYGHLMYTTSRYREFDPDARKLWWGEVRVRLIGPDLALKQPLAYSLWCDYFEDARTVEEAWSELTRPDAPPALLRVVLRNSDPVPFVLKQHLYERLIAEPAWHDSIFESLLGSAFDVYGQIEIPAARVILDRLRLRGDHPNLDLLRGKLGWTKRKRGH
jgi:hypothetical protein